MLILLSMSLSRIISSWIVFWLCREGGQEERTEEGMIDSNFCVISQPEMFSVAIGTAHSWCHVSKLFHTRRPAVSKLLLPVVSYVHGMTQCIGCMTYQLLTGEIHMLQLHTCFIILIFRITIQTVNSLEFPKYNWSWHLVMFAHLHWWAVVMEYGSCVGGR